MLCQPVTLYPLSSPLLGRKMLRKKLDKHIPSCYNWKSADMEVTRRWNIKCQFVQRINLQSHAGTREEQTGK